MTRLLIAATLCLATQATAEGRAELHQGYKRYHAVCSHCHGPAGLGSSFGPALIEIRPDPDAFRRAVMHGASGPSGEMKGFRNDANVAPYVDAILSYIDARAAGTLGRGRP
jgi:mono/diheme cytochrome c family protein